MEDILKEYIKSELINGAAEVELDKDTPLFASGLIDSMGFFRLVAFIEERFAIQVLNEELVPENFQTLAVLRQFLHNKQSAK
jgi:acyl carrier protein